MVAMSNLLQVEDESLLNKARCRFMWAKYLLELHLVFDNSNDKVIGSD
jgi:hypothetical protein